MADFNFIIIPELRQCLESDYKELQACLKAEAWKAVDVLAGSIVEAVLIDALGPAGVDQAKLDSMELAALITLAKDKGILDDEAADLSTVVRKYRNLIHPGRIKRLEKNVDGSGAIVAAQVVEIITKQVALRKRQTYGYTAEQLLERVRGGSSALPLVADLLKATPSMEVERLLIDVLPTTYFNNYEDPDLDTHLIECYRRIFDSAGRDVKVKVTKNLYKVYREGPEARVLAYEDNFLRGSDLAYLSESEGSLIKTHLLHRVSIETLRQRRRNIVGIGPFLDAEEVVYFIMVLMEAMQSEDIELEGLARHMLRTEYSGMRAGTRAEVRNLVGDYPDVAKILNKVEEREAKRKQSPRA